MADSFDVGIRFVDNGTLVTWSLLSFYYKQAARYKNKNSFSPFKSSLFRGAGFGLITRTNSGSWPALSASTETSSEGLESQNRSVEDALRIIWVHLFSTFSVVWLYELRGPITTERKQKPPKENFLQEALCFLPLQHLRICSEGSGVPSRRHLCLLVEGHYLVQDQETGLSRGHPVGWWQGQDPGPSLFPLRCVF